MLRSDLIHDRAETFLQPVASLDWQRLDARFGDIEAALLAHLRDESVARDKIEFVRSLDVRYIGQEHAIGVPLPAEIFAAGVEAPARLRKDFEAAYVTTFGHSNPEEALVAPTAAPERLREVIFDGKSCPTRFISRAGLTLGQPVIGPCVIEESTCTTIVPPDFVAEIDALGNLILTWQQA
jgi:N-methylhydantoinase A